MNEQKIIELQTMIFNRMTGNDKDFESGKISEREFLESLYWFIEKNRDMRKQMFHVKYFKKVVKVNAD